jgi:hypothetical protein
MTQRSIRISTGGGRRDELAPVWYNLEELRVERLRVEGTLELRVES